MKLASKFSVKRRIVRLRGLFSIPAEKFFSLPRQWKQSGLLALDLCFIPLAFWLAVVARWGGLIYEFKVVDLVAIMLTMVFSAAFFLRIGLYRAVIRFMGQQAIITIIQGVTVSAVILALAAFLTRSGVPRSTPIIYWATALILIGGSRLLLRSLYHSVYTKQGVKAVIYGAGVSGRQLLNTIFHGGEYQTAAIVDDDPALVGSVINGVSVYHSSQLSDLCTEFSISHVFLAMPSASHLRRREIIDELEGLPVYVKTVPDFADLMSGAAKVGQLQDIELADLLGRDTVPPDPELIDQCIRDKVVMVTGAGGSIGSELCRQIVLCQPKELILFDISEYALYQIVRELERSKAKGEHDIRITPLLGSVQNQARLESIMTEFAVNTVYHAAAYKHVPMVEYNVVEGVSNNVFGTLAAAGAAVKAGVEHFVLISTDKAVRPTNVMGASKRMAELLLQAFASKYDNTGFCMVRFGNVLGSSGSVVPLFRHQILNGGPVTVTHKDIIRYFMTIPEAAQLVLQASAMGKGGDVFVLDMGEPVRIVNLARRLIRLMGCEVKDKAHPKGDIEIHFTGLRPGEKLYEELLLGDNVTGTGHPKVMRAEESLLPEDEIDRYTQQLKEACDKNDCEAIQQTLQQAVAEFDAKDGISDAIWTRRMENGLIEASVAEDNVVTGNFPKVT
ncbi:polysaccharide biosynthesis protein [Oceanicoccus sagamiensis]|uniref:polysaccharide biosynthesis protein n=1 Tax=Oceanicoccus sagamiensis TaxID=716816 RepID=UPI000A272834|nr:nucleoside-diphosphate sugar epimerase/dehydratase [Oceanicoccus sagamiensis]